MHQYQPELDNSSLGCARCKRYTGGPLIATIYKKETRMLCEKCRMRVMPPRMELIENKSGKLFNPTINSFELFITLKDLEECGWFIRKQIHPDPQFYPEINRTLKLEYYGNVSCPRCHNYYDFPARFISCRNVTCFNQFLRSIRRGL